MSNPHRLFLPRWCAACVSITLASYTLEVRAQTTGRLAPSHPVFSAIAADVISETALTEVYPSPDRLTETPERAIAAELPDTVIPDTITVQRFEFEGNTAFDDDTLRAQLKDFTGQPITFTQLLQAEAEITRLYTEAGYINSGAVIPADQVLDPEGAVVLVRVVEGEVEEIQISGTRRLRESYIRDRLEPAAAKPLNQNELLEALQLLQLDPLIENISAELSAGSRPESSFLQVRVTEADSFSVEGFADNGRAPSVGSFRRGVRLSEGNLLGFGDRIAVDYTNTDGSNAVDFRYDLPVNSRNGTVSLAAGFTDTEVIEPPFDRIDITGDSRYLELSFRQPIVRTPDREFAVGITGSRQESDTQLLGEDFPLSAGANEDGETRISSLRLFQEWTQRGRRDVFALRSQFTIGLDVFNATTNDEPPDSRFFSWRGQAQYVRLLARDTLLVLRSDIQLADEALVPLEQFGLGGLGSVRGYRQDALLTDNGFVASAEVRLPVLRVSDVDGILHIVPFADFGVGWNGSDNPDPATNSLVGLGIGLQWQMGTYLNLRFDWGIPLTDVDDRDRTLQENGLYFSINSSVQF